jgi:hypothetical protein
MKKSTTLKPILFNQKDVAVMIRVAAFFGGASFAARIGEQEDVIDLCADLIAAGCCEPGAPILEQLNLRRVSGGYAWDPQ